MRFRWFGLLATAWLGVAAFAASGCERTPGAQLIEVSGLESTLLERGDSLRVTGSGFPPGRTAEVALRGVMHRAGERPYAVRASFVGRATHPERVLVSLNDAELAELGVSGSFDGTLEISFASPRGARVSGSQRVSFDVLGSRQAQREQAQELLARVGLVLADADTLQGVRIAGVKAHGLAQSAGLAPGDTIVAAADVRVHALSDLAAAPAARTLALRVQRPGHPDTLAVTLPLIAAGSQPAELDPRALRTGALICFVLLVLAFASPLPSPVPAAVRMLREAYALSRAHERIPSAALFALLPLTAASFAIAAQWPVDTSYVLAGCGACAGLYRIVTQRSRAGLLRVAIDVGVIAVVLAGIAISSGSAELASLLQGQGVAPFTWKMFTRPELAIGLLLLVAHAARLVPGVTEPTKPVLRTGAALITLAFALLVACIGFGGFAIHGELLDPVLFGGAWLVAKTLALAASFPLARRLGAPRHEPLWLGAFLLATGLRMLLVPSPAFELATGALFGTTLCSGLTLAAWLAFGPRAIGGFRRALPESD